MSRAPRKKKASTAKAPPAEARSGGVAMVGGGYECAAPVNPFEWIRRGDGTDVLYKNGQVCGDADEIREQRAIREASA